MEQTKATAQASAAVLMRQEKQVKIYDQALQRKGVIDVYRSLIWTRKYKGLVNYPLYSVSAIFG